LLLFEFQERCFVIIEPSKKQEKATKNSDKSSESEFIPTCEQYSEHHQDQPQQYNATLLKAFYCLARFHFSSTSRFRLFPIQLIPARQTP